MTRTATVEDNRIEWVSFGGWNIVSNYCGQDVVYREETCDASEAARWFKAEIKLTRREYGV